MLIAKFCLQYVLNYFFDLSDQGQGLAIIWDCSYSRILNPISLTEDIEFVTDLVSDHDFRGSCSYIDVYLVNHDCSRKRFQPNEYFRIEEVRQPVLSILYCLVSTKCEVWILRRYLFRKNPILWSSSNAKQSGYRLPTVFDLSCGWYL
jgi:hypothetical protein